VATRKKATRKKAVEKPKEDPLAMPEEDPLALENYEDLPKNTGEEPEGQRVIDPVDDEKRLEWLRLNELPYNEKVNNPLFMEQVTAGSSKFVLVEEYLANLKE
jgi:hypothetical protein